jgi:CheY-like chemotaxis protein
LTSPAGARNFRDIAQNRGIIVSLKILLADDSMTAQNMGKKILTEGGYDVVTVSNGAAAVKKLAEFTPDLVIADVYMPGYNGLEICERIKKAAATSAIPVLLSVGKLEPFRPEEGLKVHADGIIIKPFEATDLLAVTAKLAERVGKGVTAAEPEQPPEQTVGAAEESAAEHAASTPLAQQAAVGTRASVPAFDLEETGSAPAFAIDDKPSYVREFGLDPHDAPTTIFRVPSDHAHAVAEPSFMAEVPDFETPAVEESLVAAVPGSLNLAINDVALPEPESLDDIPSAPARVEDDFEAKLAAAMAEYEPPASLDTKIATEAASEPVVKALGTADTIQMVAAAASVASVMPVAPSWVAEEAPVSQAEQALSLEDELRAYAAVAAGSSGTAVQTVAPAPLGDTSVDDEVSAIVGQSKERFFPAMLSERVDAVMNHATVLGSFPDEEAANENEVDVLSSDRDIEALPVEPMLEIPEELVTESQPEMLGASMIEADLATEELVTEDLLTAEPDVPELITHDVPTEWTVTPSAPVFSGQESQTDPFESAVEEFSSAHHDFELPEAPFAHEAVDEPLPTLTVNEEQPSAQVASVVDHTREELVEQMQSAAPSLQETDIADAVTRVMDRMKGDLIAQIAKELAAKMGK